MAADKQRTAGDEEPDRDPAEKPVPVLPGPATADSGVVVRQILTLLGNLTVITALLVYFGWRRTETLARALGFDESILGMTARDYIMRSVGPVLALLLTVAIAGLLWLWADRQLTRLAGWAGLRWAVRVLTFGWLILPFLVWLAGFVRPWRAVAFVAFPLAIAGGILLTLYAEQLRRTVLAGTPGPPRHESLVRGFAAILVAGCLFWAASNYAEVLGNTLALRTAYDVESGSGVKVVVYSPKRLHITAPGVVEEPLTGADAAYRFRYRGLVLLDHIGGRTFLISDGWTRDNGVVVVVDDDTVRMEYVHGNPSGPPTGTR